MRWFPIPSCFLRICLFFLTPKRALHSFLKGDQNWCAFCYFLFFGLAGGLLFFLFLSFLFFGLICGPFYNCIYQKTKVRGWSCKFYHLHLHLHDREGEKEIRYESKQEKPPKKSLSCHTNVNPSNMMEAHVKKEAETSCWSVRCVAFLPRRIENPIW